MLLSFQRVFPFYWDIEEYRTYEVEFIRAPVEDLNLDDEAGAGQTRLDEKNEEDIADVQDTISLDTKDKRYISYANIVKVRISKHWVYPAQAKEYLLEGMVKTLFSLERDGKMTRISIIKGSGYEILDNEVIRAITNAAPFPPFPDSISVTRLNIKADFDYRITTKRRSSR
jgi:TonB family protein